MEILQVDRLRKDAAFVLDYVREHVQVSADQAKVQIELAHAYMALANDIVRTKKNNFTREEIAAGYASGAYPLY